MATFTGGANGALMGNNGDDSPITPRAPKVEAFGDWRSGSTSAHNHEGLIEIDERLQEIHQIAVQTRNQLEHLSVTVNRIDLEFERARDQLLILVASTRQHDQVLIEIGHGQQALAKSNEHLAIELTNNMEAAKRHSTNLERSLSALRQRVDSHDTQIDRSETFGRAEIISTHEEAKLFKELAVDAKKRWAGVAAAIVLAVATAIIGWLLGHK